MIRTATLPAQAPPQYAPVRVRPLRGDDAPAWAAYVARAPSATFFHRIEWLDILVETFGHRPHYLVAERGKCIVGVLPLAEVRTRLFGHMLTSLPFCVQAGPIADDEEALEALIEGAEALGDELQVAHLELRSCAPLRPHWPQNDLYFTFRKAIAPDDEANLLAIPRKQRAMVRKGVRQGLVSEIDAGMDRFFALYADNMHRHGTPPHSRAYFERLRSAFGDDCEVLTVLAPGGKPVSSVLSFRFRDEILPYYAGDLTDARDLAANDFKYWEVMRLACARGARVFDYGRSKRGTGSFDFKGNWGFEPAPLHYAFRLYRGGEVPQQHPLNPKYRTLIAVWQRLPRSLVNAVGPYVVRGLG